MFSPKITMSSQIEKEIAEDAESLDVVYQQLTNLIREHPALKERGDDCFRYEVKKVKGTQIDPITYFYAVVSTSLASR